LRSRPDSRLIPEGDFRMNNRKAFGGFIGGAFKMFVEGMTPGVIAGPSILMLILLKDTDTYGKAFRR